ncbi:MAG: hypothetical protein GXY85_08880 [Candidatus Brocadiaceae bacterium]|nr:hypothetical protein [Candidatus Brocadiaceae bacterium]
MHGGGGAPIPSADAFGEVIEKALADGKPNVRLTVEYLGKSRFADLDLSLVPEED